MVHVEHNHISELEGLLVVEHPGVGVLVLGSFQELSGPDARVLVGHLSHHDGVVSAEETDNELTVIVILGMTDQTGFETEDILIVGENFFDIFFGGLGVQAEH